ncbi:uncharacterized protein LOC106138291 [Amyelois transitella]|uniref:uncharacterized protein LOC106138291 n=1 Tax=Amyelois transitella TaxID=680683 RepID=UPI00298F66BA|nr:uncharacterized protein LOC106138291 [Amyelois transitella]
MQTLSSTFVVISEDDDVEMDDVVPYAPHTFLFQYTDLENFEELFMKILASPYWHPLTNLILLCEGPLANDVIAKLFFIMWYHKSCNAIIVQFDDAEEVLRVTHYNPYVSGSGLQNFGCWTARKIGIPVSSFEEGFVCVEGCHNVTQHSKLRANNLGICIAFQTNVIPNGNTKLLQKLNLLEELGKNLHGFSLRAYTTEVKPFLVIDEQGNGTYALSARDGKVWNTASEVMNFSIDLSPVASSIKLKFDFELNIQQIYGFAHRKADLFLIPIYQFDLIIVELDHTFPIKESGLCLLAHRAGFETNLFDSKLLKDNYKLIIEFVFCFVCMWILFFIYNIVEKDRISLDQAGKDLINVFRSILNISLYKEPKSRSFRIYLTTSIWSFFLLSFFMQAAIISFFSSFRRGKEVNTFDDIIEKGYPIEGLASPDSMLPDTEERFRKLNSKLVSVQNFFECTERMMNDSHRFCLIDCAVGRYLERNKLNDKGQQYLHIVRDDKFHSLYLNMIFPKHSPLTKTFNELTMRLFEAGLIKKWEEYRFNDIKEEAGIKPLGLDDLMGIFKCYGLLVALCVLVFFIELIIGFTKYCAKTIAKWKRTRIAKKQVKLERKKGKIKHIESYTQT